MALTIYLNSTTQTKTTATAAPTTGEQMQRQDTTGIDERMRRVWREVQRRDLDLYEGGRRSPFTEVIRRGVVARPFGGCCSSCRGASLASRRRGRFLATIRSAVQVKPASSTGNRRPGRDFAHAQTPRRARAGRAGVGGQVTGADKVSRASAARARVNCSRRVDR